MRRSGMAYGDRAEAADLCTLMKDPGVQKDPELYLKVVRKVIASMTLGVDVSSLFMDMIKAGDTVRLVQKKMVYLYLSSYGSCQPELALLTLNTLMKDLDGPNAMIRGLALRTLTSLRSTEVVKYLPEILQRGLNDSSAYVRKSAVMGVVKLFHVDPDVVDKMNFVDVLYQMLRDRDAQVVSNCLAALSEILAGEGGVVINTKIAHYLLNRLDDFNEWGQSQIAGLLTCYNTASEEELFDVLNILDGKLKSANSGVVLAVTRLFLNYTTHVPHLHDDICERVRNPLLTFACIDYIEISYVFLLHAQLMLAKFPHMWRKHYQNFYFRATDPVFIKVKKIELLDEVCMYESVPQITSELSMYMTDSNPLVAKASTQALGSIAQKIPSQANMCVDQLLPYLGCHAVDHITSEALVVITSILRKFDTMLECILPKLPHYSVLTEARGKAALMWILGEYGENLPSTPYVLEKVVGGVAEERSPDVRLQLLSAVMKMFFKRPPECQEMLGRLLEHTINEEEDMDVRDRGLLYYRLLSKNLKVAKKAVCGFPKTVELQSTNERECLLPEFNSLSVMFGKLSDKFTEQRFPYICNTKGTSSGAEAGFEAGIGGPFQKSRDEILLNPEASISAADFEQKWSAWSVVKELHIHVERLLPQDQFLKQLASQHIFNMAASPLNHKLVKYYFFAQELSSQNYFLLEVDVVEDNMMMSCLFKSEHAEQCTWFSKKFLEAQNFPSDPAPLLSLRTCSDIPTGMSNACGVIHHNQLYVSGRTNFDKTDNKLYAYSPDVDIWKVLPPCPLKWSGIAVWRDRLVLLGGEEASSSSTDRKSVASNRVAVWENGKWACSLPPMVIARVSPMAVADEHYLAAAGGREDHLARSVEVLSSKTLQWNMVRPLPVQCPPHLHVICKSSLYLLHHDTSTILQANLHKFLKQSSISPDLDAPLTIPSSGRDVNRSEEKAKPEVSWNSIPIPPVEPLRMASIGGYIVVFSTSETHHGNMDIHSYFPETNSWWLVGTTPTLSDTTTCVCSTESDLFFVGGDGTGSKFSQQLHQAVFKKS